MRRPQSSATLDRRKASNTIPFSNSPWSVRRSNLDSITDESAPSTSSQGRKDDSIRHEALKPHELAEALAGSKTGGLLKTDSGDFTTSSTNRVVVSAVQCLNVVRQRILRTKLDSCAYSLVESNDNDAVCPRHERHSAGVRTLHGNAMPRPHTASLNDTSAAKTAPYASGPFRTATLVDMAVESAATTSSMADPDVENSAAYASASVPNSNGAAALAHLSRQANESRSSVPVASRYVRSPDRIATAHHGRTLDRPLTAAKSPLRRPDRRVSPLMKGAGRRTSPVPVGDAAARPKTFSAHVQELLEAGRVVSSDVDPSSLTSAAALTSSEVDSAVAPSVLDLAEQLFSFGERQKRIQNELEQNGAWVGYWGQVDQMKIIIDALMQEVRHANATSQRLKIECDGLRSQLRSSLEGTSLLVHRMDDDRDELERLRAHDESQRAALKADNGRLAMAVDQLRRRLMNAEVIATRAEEQSRKDEVVASRATAELEAVTHRHALEVAQLRREKTAASRVADEKVSRLDYLETEVNRQSEYNRVIQRTLDFVSKERDDLKAKMAAVELGIAEAQSDIDASLASMPSATGLTARELQQMTLAVMKRREEELNKAMAKTKDDCRKLAAKLKVVPRVLRARIERLEAEVQELVDVDAVTGIRGAVIFPTAGKGIAVSSPTTSKKGGRKKKGDGDRYACDPFVFPTLTDEQVGMVSKAGVYNFNQGLSSPMLACDEGLRESILLMQDAFSAIQTAVNAAWTPILQCIPADSMNRPSGAREKIHSSIQNGLLLLHGRFNAIVAGYVAAVDKRASAFSEEMRRRDDVAKAERNKALQSESRMQGRITALEGELTERDASLSRAVQEATQTHKEVVASVERVCACLRLSLSTEPLPPRESTLLATSSTLVLPELLAVGDDVARLERAVRAKWGSNAGSPLAASLNPASSFRGGVAASQRRADTLPLRLPPQPEGTASGVARPPSGVEDESMAGSLRLGGSIGASPKVGQLAQPANRPQHNASSSFGLGAVGSSTSSNDQSPVARPAIASDAEKAGDIATTTTQQRRGDALSRSVSKSPSAVTGQSTVRSGADNSAGPQEPFVGAGAESQRRKERITNDEASPYHPNAPSVAAGGSVMPAELSPKQPSAHATRPTGASSSDATNAVRSAPAAVQNRAPPRDSDNGGMVASSAAKARPEPLAPTTMTADAPPPTADDASFGPSVASPGASSPTVRKVFSGAAGPLTNNTGSKWESSAKGLSVKRSGGK